MNLSQIVEQLESCNFECEAGPLVNNVVFKELKILAKSEPKQVTINVTINNKPEMSQEEISRLILDNLEGATHNAF